MQTSSPLPLRRSSRTTKVPERFSLFSTLDPLSIPRSYKQATDSAQWSSAMHEEIKAVEENQTWEIVPAPKTHPIAGSKWVFSIKLNPDGTLDQYKAQLVA